ncbi:hypothetical protein [Caulobacter sp. 17J80-11]|uniref:hypothetical protein n=1 Tax=Caulobacter sp. 17J80-11 TaxID=2763502 RepID=UPI001653CA8D|nr:hypothetical protein [Caulobacter sp. 17J80-11]MBC6983310.1 hypothetical protein [Caulobacter sp. 17J80-11]
MQIDDPYLPGASADRRIIVYSTTSLAGVPEPVEAAADRRIIVYTTTSLTDHDQSAALHEPSATVHVGDDWMF